MLTVQYESNTNFWIVADAIKNFYADHKALPLPGSVPDMKAESDVYVRLQNIYKNKARKDVAEVLEIVHAHPYGETVEKPEVETFCKNAAFIKLIRITDGTSSSIKEVAGKYLSHPLPLLA